MIWKNIFAILIEFYVKQIIQYGKHLNRGTEQEIHGMSTDSIYVVKISSSSLICINYGFFLNEKSSALMQNRKKKPRFILLNISIDYW